MNYKLKTVDIIICVHNALEDVKKCLSAILENTTYPYQLYIINDGSAQETTDFLNNFCTQHPITILLHNETAQGYTKAANKGLQTAKSDYVILLNSDTIVSTLWLEGMLECGESDPKIGIIGALSNAASWQSVPERFAGKDWAINELPIDLTVNDMAKIVSQVSEKCFPRVPFVNGFCFAIKRQLIEKIGYLDDIHFPKGYGEENDYCLRAANANFTLAIADHVYIYHAKSKSYTHNRRAELSRQGDKALKKKHGTRIINQHVKSLRTNSDLANIRKKLKSALKHYQIKDIQSPKIMNRFFNLSILKDRFLKIIKIN